VQRWRLAALHGAMELFWRGPNEDFVAARSVTIASPLVTDIEQKTFDVTFALGPGAAAVRFDLPPFAGYRYRLTSIEPAGLVQSGQHDLEVGANGILLATGPDPFLIFATPTTGLSSLRFVGEVR